MVCLKNGRGAGEGQRDAGGAVPSSRLLHKRIEVDPQRCQTSPHYRRDVGLLPAPQTAGEEYLSRTIHCQTRLGLAEVMALVGRQQIRHGNASAVQRRRDGAGLHRRHTRVIRPLKNEKWCNG